MKNATKKKNMKCEERRGTLTQLSIIKSGFELTNDMAAEDVVNFSNGI